jgi:hypothetical protein
MDSPCEPARMRHNFDAGRRQCGGEVGMPEELKRLLEASRQREMSASEKEAQRRSFAYGNTAFENPLITREMVDEEARKLASESGRGDRQTG